MEATTSNSLSSRKIKRPLSVCNSAYRGSDESSATVALTSGSKKARVTSGFDNDPSISPLLSEFSVISTDDTGKSTSLTTEKQLLKKRNQTSRRVSLESARLVVTSSAADESFTAPVCNREVKVTLRTGSSAVTPFPSTVDLKEIADGDRKLVFLKSTPLAESDLVPDCQSSLMMSKRYDSQTTSVHPLSNTAPVSDTPFSSTVNLREPVIIDEGEMRLESHSQIGEETVACIDSSTLPISAKETKEIAGPVQMTQQYGIRSALKFACSAVLLLFYFAQSNSRPVLTSKHTVFVPGAGFSGFWYTLGKLRSIPSPSEKEFYCYSSGCLAGVAILRNLTVGEVYGMARDVQVRWQGGELHRYEVVAAFLDDLLGDTLVTESTRNATDFDPTPLLSLNIITSVHRGGPMLAPEIRRADSLEILRTMLLQTTWIPFAVGGSLWHNDHMDGAFTAGQHPLCALKVELPLDFDMVTNAVNMNLGKDKVEKFYNMGLQHGF